MAKWYMEAMDFSTVVYHLVDEISNQNDLSDEARVEVLRSLFLPHKFVDAPNATASLSLDGLRRRLSRSATRASIHRPDVSGFNPMNKILALIYATPKFKPSDWLRKVT